MQKFKPAQVLFSLSFLLPPLLVAYCIFEYGVDLIDWDQWAVAVFFEKAANGTLSLADLFAQQAEYRQFFPNLIFVGLGWITHWNIKCEMFVSLLLACLVSLNIYRLGQITLGGERSRLMLLMLLSNLLIFSPAEYENWLLGEQIIYFIPVACLTASLRVALSNSNEQLKIVLCMVLAAVATFSSANGIVCWIVIPPVLFLADRETKRYVIWITGFTSSLALYLHDYQHPAYTPSLTEALHEPLRAAIFFFNLLGSPLVGSHRLMPAATVIGVVLTTLFLASSVYLWKFVKDVDRARGSMVWLMLAAYSLLTALIITISRVGFGLYQSLTPRYTTFSIYLLVALCFLGAIIIVDHRTAGSPRLVHTSRRIGRLVPYAVASLLLLQLLTSAAAFRSMTWNKLRRLQTKSCLLFIDSVPDQCLDDNGLPDLSVVTERLNSLNDLGYLRPRLIKSDRVEEIAATSAPDAAPSGRFEGLDQLESKALFASGWAGNSDGTQPADTVLLTYKTENTDPVIFCMSEMKTVEPSFTALFRKNPPEDWRWQRSFPLEKIPIEPPFSIGAWTFDATTGRAYELPGTFVIGEDMSNPRPQGRKDQ